MHLASLPAQGRKTRLRLLILLATISLAMTTAVFANTSVANADTPGNGVGHVYLNLNVPGFTAQSQYSSFITSLRNAAGHSFRDGVLVTQGSSNAIIRVDVTAPGGQVLWLWVTPDNLYVRGFTSAANDFTYYFNDGYNLQQEFNALGGNEANPLLPPAYYDTFALNFGGNYNSLTQAAGRGRESMPISFNDLVGSVTNLATTTSPYGGNQQAIARSLMFMIQFTSEAARFWDVYGLMAAIMNSYGSSYSGLPILQQYLENSWDPISTFGANITANPNTNPVTVRVGTDQWQTFYSWGDVKGRMAIMLSTNVQYDYNGDWNSTEL
jgi:hypothetical protein